MASLGEMETMGVLGLRSWKWFNDAVNITVAIGKKIPSVHGHSGLDRRQVSQNLFACFLLLSILGWPKTYTSLM